MVDIQRLDNPIPIPSGLCMRPLRQRKPNDWACAWRSPTPKHGSWLDIAEIELRALTRFRSAYLDA
jgi:hypothetical protein